MTAKIMIVDDDRLLTSLMRVWFEKKGIEVVECNEPEKAVTEALEYKPDMAIIDVYMDKVSGFDVATSMKRNHETADIPIIFVSAQMDSNTAQHAFIVGALDVLQKPIDLHALLQKAKPLIDFGKLHKLIRELLE